jgi:hypothetical protein
LPDGIEITDCAIGTGGFTGTVVLDLLADENVTDYDDNRAKTIFGFSFTLQSVNIELKQNALTASSIKGFLKVPFFD